MSNICDFLPPSSARAPRVVAMGGVVAARARGWIALIATITLAAANEPARGEAFKCVDPSGKTSYQTDPCATASDATQKVQAPTPPASSARPTGAAATPPASSGAASTTSRGPKHRIPSEADFRGPRETWERLGAAIRRGDKDAALKEMTPSARQRLASVFDGIGSKPAPFNADQLGAIRSVTLAGEGLATITLTRTKADGIYLYKVNLIRDADGKWRVDTM